MDLFWNSSYLVTIMVWDLDEITVFLFQDRQMTMEYIRRSPEVYQEVLRKFFDIIWLGTF